MTYLDVRSAAAMVDGGFAVDAVLLKGKLQEMDEIVKHFIVTCDDKSAVFAIKCMRYVEGLGTTAKCFWRLGGVKL